MKRRGEKTRGFWGPKPWKSFLIETTTDSIKSLNLCYKHFSDAENGVNLIKLMG